LLLETNSDFPQLENKASGSPWIKVDNLAEGLESLGSERRTAKGSGSEGHFVVNKGLEKRRGN
jgi:hypothetical protein